MNESASMPDMPPSDGCASDEDQAQWLASTPWILRRRSHAQPSLRIYCFSYGGGGASAFAAWPRYLDPRIELCPVQLPGRENRRTEAPLVRLDAVYRFFEALARRDDRTPFVFFGYCMGGRIALALARHLRRERLPLPEALFIAAAREPSCMPRKAIPTYRLDDDALLQFASRFADIPAFILKRPQLARRMLALLRADIELSETIEFAPQAPFAFPLTIFGGRQDDVVRIEHLMPWKDHSTGPFTLQMLDGPHMFLERQCEAIHAQMGAQLAPLLGARAIA
jgi:surfactin synthase thioesterase subunit